MFVKFRLVSPGVAPVVPSTSKQRCMAGIGLYSGHCPLFQNHVAELLWPTCIQHAQNGKIMYFKIGMFETITLWIWLKATCLWLCFSDRLPEPLCSMVLMPQSPADWHVSRQHTKKLSPLRKWVWALGLASFSLYVQFFPASVLLSHLSFVFSVVVFFEKGEIKCVWYFSMLTAQATWG